MAFLSSAMVKERKNPVCVSVSVFLDGKGKPRVKTSVSTGDADALSHEEGDEEMAEEVFDVQIPDVAVNVSVDMQTPVPQAAKTPAKARKKNAKKAGTTTGRKTKKQ